MNRQLERPAAPSQRGRMAGEETAVGVVDGRPTAGEDLRPQRSTPTRVAVSGEPSRAARGAQRYWRRRGWAALVVLAVASLAVVGLLAAWIPIGPGLQRTYGVTAAATTTAGSLFAAAFAVGELGAGPIADRYGRRPVLLAGLAMLALASLAVAASPTWPVHLAARVGQAVAAGSFCPVAVAWVADALPATRRRFAMAVLITAFQAAAITGQLHSQVLDAALGWRAVYASLAAVYLLAAVLLACWLAEPAVAERPKATAGSTARRVAGLLKVPTLWASWLLSAVLWGGLLAMYASLQEFLPASGLGDSGALLRIRLIGAAAVLAVPLLVLVIRLSTMGLILAGTAVAAAGLLAAQLDGGLWVVVAGSALVAAGATLAMVPLTELIGQVAVAATASAMAVQSFTLDMAASGGAALSVWLSYTALCLLLALTMIGGAGLLAATVWSSRADHPRRASQVADVDEWPQPPLVQSLLVRKSPP